jgi:hypothetical protein
MRDGVDDERSSLAENNEDVFCSLMLALTGDTRFNRKWIQAGGELRDVLMASSESNINDCNAEMTFWETGAQNQRMAKNP